MSETIHSGFSNNAAGAITYITIVPAIVFLVLPPYNTNPYVRFHAWQSIFLNVIAFIVDFALIASASKALIMGPLLLSALIRGIWVLWTLTWVLCAVQAMNGHLFKIPLIGQLAEKIANK